MLQNYAISTVVTAATSFDLTTLANVKADLNISGSAEDAYLKRLISQASQAVAQYCNRTFAQQTYQDTIRPQRDSRTYFLPNGRQPMFVRNVPLVSVASVTENAIALVLATDYEVDTENGFIFRLNSNGDPQDWPAYKIVIQYVAGWTLPGNPGSTLPSDIEDACIRLIKNRRLARTRDSSLKVDEVEGIGRQEYWIATGVDSGNMTPDIMDILNNYRIFPIA